MERFFTLKSVQDFAQSCGDFWNMAGLSEPGDREQYTGLEVPGVSELVPVFEVCQNWDHFKKCYEGYFYLDVKYWGLRMIATGEVFKIGRKKWNERKYRLYLLDHVYVPGNRDRCFKYEGQEPQYIGVATAKKLASWVDYCHAERDARLSYLDSALAVNRAYVEKFRAKYPEARFTTLEDGWTSQFVLTFERLRICFTAGESGTFYKDISVDSAPTDEELLK